MSWPIPVEPPLPEGYARDAECRRRFERPYLAIRALGVLVMLGGLGSFLLLPSLAREHQAASLLGLVGCWFGGLALLLGTLAVQARRTAWCARCGGAMRVVNESPGIRVYLCDSCRVGFRRVFAFGRRGPPSSGS